MPRQFTVDPTLLQPVSVSLTELSPVEEPPVQQDDQGGDTARMVTNALPMALATAGSLIAGGKSNPVGMALAGIGGAGGEAWRQTLQAIQGNWEDVPPDLRSQAEAIMTEGIKQGGVEGIGRYVFGPLLKLLGRSTYRAALKPSLEIRRDFATAGKPLSGGRSVTDTLIEHGIPITRSGSGTEKAAAALSASGRDTAQTLAAAEAAGAKPVTMRPVVKALDRTRQSVSDRVVRSGPQQEVQAMRDAALRENPARVSLTRAQAMKQAEQDVAINAYKQQAKGAPVNSVELSMHEDLARGLKDAIERRVPGIRNKNMRTQRLIGAVKAVANAEGRIANNNVIGMGDALALGAGAVGTSAVGPGGAALGIIQEVLTRPEIASRLGISLDRAGRPLVTPQIMRVVSEAVSNLESRR